MRKIFTIIVAVLLTANMFAQAPEKMSYQAVVRNSSDLLVTNTQVGIQISILQGSASGTTVYVETQTPTTNANGLVSVEIGGGTVVIGDFYTVDWANGPYFIQTETDPSGGANYTITGVSQLLSVPYALYAKTSGSSIPGPQGEQGLQGETGEPGPAGADGVDGKSAYDIWIVAGNTGTESEFIASLKGEKGDVGEQGAQGEAGADGVGGVTQVAASSILSLTGAGTVADPYIMDATETDPTFTAWDKDYADIINTPLTITTAQANEISANTLKVGYTEALVSANADVLANTAKVGITTEQANEISANTLKVGYTDDLVSANADVVANTAKVGITTAQSDAITANTAKVGYTEALVSANTDVAANTAKVGITTEQANEISVNTLKVGYTDALVSANADVIANTAKVGITTEQSDAITANTAKVGYTEALVSANTDVAANTAKVGITTQQTSDITANNAKIGYTDALVSANPDVAANTAKVGITTAQADAIIANTAKVGITTQQASEIAANTLKTGITAQQASDITTNNAKVGITTEQTTKLAGIADGAQVNVQADWNQTTNTADDYIKNKPTIPAAVDGSETKVTAGTNISITGTGTTENPYIINSTAGGSGTHYLGEEYLGGIIYYIYTGSDGQQHGLIVSKTESIKPWGPLGEYGAIETSDGAFNTNLMPVSTGEARTWVETLGTGWYIPAIDELILLFQNRFHVNNSAASGLTLLSNLNTYWSSTEIDMTVAMSISFRSGSTEKYGPDTYDAEGFIVEGLLINKQDAYSLRAVRAF